MSRGIGETVNNCRNRHELHYAGGIGGLFWSAYGWSGVISMIAALQAAAYLAERRVSRALRQREPASPHADAS